MDGRGRAGWWGGGAGSVHAAPVHLVNDVSDRNLSTMPRRSAQAAPAPRAAGPPERFNRRNKDPESRRSAPPPGAFVRTWRLPAAVPPGSKFSTEMTPVRRSIARTSPVPATCRKEML